MHTIFSCKHSFKKKVEMKVLKEIILELFNQYEETDLIENNQNSKEIYTSIFNVYNSYEEFIEKNLIKLTDIKTYLTKTWKIKWNMIMINKRNNDNIVNDRANYKWLRFISELNFINDLITISDILRFIKVEERESTLKEFILYINKEKLPCRLYDPLQIRNESYNNSSTELLRIDDKISYSINTRERVPCQLIFEFNTQIDKVIVEEEKKSDSTSGSPKERKSVLIPKIRLNEKQLISNDYYTNYTFFSNMMSCFGDINSKPNSNTKQNFNDDQEEEENNEDSIRPEGNESISSLVKSIGIFGSLSFSDIQKKSLSESKYKDKIAHNKNRFIISSIIKGNDELRQDFFVSQVITLFNFIFATDPTLPIHLKPCNIMSNGTGGFIQTIINSTSLAKINKIVFPSNSNANSLNIFYSNNNINYDNFSNLKKYFIYKFGNNSFEYDDELNNFIYSLAGYCLLCYFLEIKDRNNGNILLNDKGQLIHIDFGFLFNKSPGNLAFEKAPFKFTRDFIDLMEGDQSRYFLKFQEIFFKAFMLVRKNKLYLMKMIEIFCDLFSDLNCFSNKEDILSRLNDKFRNDAKSEDELIKHCNELIQISIDNWRTKAYDKYQKFCVGIN